MVAAGLPGAVARRTDAGRRRRRALGDLRADPHAGIQRGRDRAGLQRGRGSARSVRPGRRTAGGAGRPHRARARHRRASGPRPGDGRKCGVMSEDITTPGTTQNTNQDTNQNTNQDTNQNTGPGATPSSQATVTPPTARRSTSLLRTGAGRNLGLVVALVLLCIVGVVTAGDTFATGANVLTILRLAAVIGVVSVGMTFVITGGGIDLSVGAMVALASVWATTLATQQLAADYHWIFMVTTALVVGAACGLVNGVLVAYGKIVPFIATLAMLAAARGLAEIISDRKTQIISVNSFTDFFGGSLIGVPVLVWIFVLVAAAGWVVL